jgi:hypothetical protein
MNTRLLLAALSLAATSLALACSSDPDPTPAPAPGGSSSGATSSGASGSSGATSSGASGSSGATSSGASGSSGATSSGASGSTSSGSSGADAGTCTAPTAGGTLGALSAADKALVCDYSACPYGGYGKSKDCGNGVTVSFKSDSQQECLADPLIWTKCANLPLSDYTACMAKTGVDPCKGAAVLQSDPACAALLACATSQ